MDYKKAIAKLICEILGNLTVSENEIAESINTPPDQNLGDYALPCFKFSKIFKKSPVEIANKISVQINQNKLPKFLDKAQAYNGYLNFYLNRAEFVSEVLNNNLSGIPVQNIGQGKIICIDYSSINIAKPFHIGHLSTTAIGGSLYRIFNYLGYNTVGINHLGDYGTQFGKLVCAYILWGNEQKLNTRGLNELLDLYVKFHTEAEINHSLEEEARKWSKLIEDGDEQALKIYDNFKEITISEIDVIYKRLGIKFDSYLGESFFAKRISPVISLLKEKGILIESQGAQVVDLEKYDMPPCLILRSDGASLYATRDIAAAIYRKETYNFHKCLYVIAYQQNLHLKQFFRVLDLMEFPWAKDLVHVPFGMVSTNDGTLSTRSGKVVFLAELLDRAVEKTKNIIKEKNPDAVNIDEISEAVGVGAVVFSALSNSRIKDIVFSWDKALSFDGETGPYLQYTHARCCSVLKKAGVNYNNRVFPKSLIEIKPDFKTLTDGNTLRLIKLIDSFPNTIISAAENYEPSEISKALIDIAQCYNKFYFDYRIIDDDFAIQKARLILTLIVKDCLHTGLQLILLKPIEQM